MSQFVCITGASLPETKWFSKTGNALGEQIGHILKDAETAAICFVKGLNRIKIRFSPFSWRIFAVVSAIMTLFMGL